MQDLTAKLQAAEEDCKEHAARVQEAEDKLAQHNNKLNSHLEAKEVQDREAMEKLEQASKVHNGFEDRIAAMSEGQSAGMQQLSESLEVAQQEARALQTKVEGLEKQCRDLESRKSALERERDEIQGKLESRENAQGKAEEDLASLQMQHNGMQEQLKKEADAIQDLRDKLQAAEDAGKRQAALVQETDGRMKEQLGQAGRERKDLEDRIAAMSEGQSAGMQQLSESLEVAQQEARALQTKVEGLEKQCRDLESRKSAMERERDEIERKLELGEQDMAKANEDLDIHKQEVTSLRARMYELDQAQSLVQQLRSEVSMHKIERDGLQQQLDASNIGFRQLRQVRLVVVPSVPDTVGLLNLPCYILGMTLSWSGAGQ